MIPKSNFKKGQEISKVIKNKKKEKSDITLISIYGAEKIKYFNASESIRLKNILKEFETKFKVKDIKEKDVIKNIFESYAIYPSIYPKKFVFNVIEFYTYYKKLFKKELTKDQERWLYKYFMKDSEFKKVYDVFKTKYTQNNKFQFLIDIEKNKDKLKLIDMYQRLLVDYNFKLSENKQSFFVNELLDPKTKYEIKDEVSLRNLLSK